MAAPRALAVLGVLLAIAVGHAEAASVVVGLAKCADCTRKNMKAQEAFKGLQVAIKCKDVHGDYESKAVGALDGTGAFSVPLAADLHGADCVAQLHSAASKAPCPGQEPSKVVPVSEGTTYGVIAGAKATVASPECASVTLCGPIKKHILEHFHHKKPVPPKPEYKPQPHPDYHPVPYKPEPKPQPHPDYHPVPPTPTYGGGGGHPSTPIYHSETSKTFLGPVKKHIIEHIHHKKEFLEHFHHKKPMPSKPEYKPQPHPEYHPVPYKPEPKPQPHPDYHPVPPTPTYGGGGGHPATPIYHAETSKTFLGPVKKHIIEHIHHKKEFLEHFHHKKPMPSKPEYKPQPHPDYHPVPYKPEPKPQPHPDYHPVPPTPTYGGGGGHPSTPIYHTETSKTLGPIKKHIIDHLHHKKPVPPKPEPKPHPHPDYHPVPPTPTYGGGGGYPSSPIYHAETSKTMLGPIKKHIIEHFHRKKPMPSKSEPKPQPHPDYHPVPPTPTYGGGGGHPSTPIYHPPAEH